MKIYFILLSILLTNSLCAQDYVDVLRFSYSNTSQNNFEESQASTRIEDFYLETTLPIALNSSTHFLTGFICERIQTRLFENEPVETFSSASLKIGINRMHSEKWSGTYALLPKIASDFQSINRKDFQLGGFALLKYKKNDHMSYKVGLYTNSELFGPWFVPLLGLYYLSANKKFEANLTLPISADINYALYQSASIGLNYFGQVRTYHLSKITSESNGYVHRSTNEISAYLKFAITKSLILQTKVGHSVGRYYRVYNENDKITIGFPLLYINDNRHQLNTDFNDGWIYQAVVMYRIHKHN